MADLDDLVSEVIAQLLVDLGDAGGLGTGSYGVFVEGLPDSPDEAISTRQTDSRLHGRTHPDNDMQQHFGCQIRVRGKANDLKTAYDKCRDIATSLDSVKLQTVTVNSNSYLVHSVNRQTDVLPIGPEPETSRRSYVLNVLTSLRQTS